MPSAVTICNLALGFLGDSATVSSIYPPEGSAQAQHCARFYPVALAQLLESYAWSFATTRQALAQVSNPSSTWQYAYVKPSAAVNLLAVLDPCAMDDFEVNFPPLDAPFALGYRTVPTAAYYTPQPYELETDSNGNSLILTNQANAVLRYTQLVTDTTKFSPLFVSALAWLLASMLAGPILKGDAGAQAAARCMGVFNALAGTAKSSDANSNKTNPQPIVAWIAGR